MEDDNDGLLAGVSVVGVGLAALAAYVVAQNDGATTGPGSAATSRVQDAVESAGGRIPSAASDPTDATDIANEIRARANSATNPATGIFEEDLGSGPLGSDGIVSPSDVPSDSPLSAYELELADTDTGE
jgi:hypothetical protein